jgi:hypothetical protein
LSCALRISSAGDEAQKAADYFELLVSGGKAAGAFTAHFDDVDDLSSTAS